MTKRILLGLAVLFATTLPAAALELVMFEAPGCTYCAQWHEEVGDAYPKTAEGKRAPLRIVGLHVKRPADLTGIKAVTFSPTFVLVEDGRELGRILGYPGEEFFWPMLGELLEEVPSDPQG